MNPLFCTDSYKLSHKGFMTNGTEVIYSNLTMRNMKYLPVLKDRHDGKGVNFGLQGVLKQLVSMWDRFFFYRQKSEVISEAKEFFDLYLGPDSVDMHHFEELHDLGYLPILVKALPEGSRVNAKVPVFTIRNTDIRFAWLTNYLETWLSSQLWKQMTIATIAYEYRALVNEFALLTTGSTAGTEFQVHDFSYRGLSGTEDAAASGAAFLLSTCGTDNIPGLYYATKFYGANMKTGLIGTSVPASEHSLASTGIAVDGELETYRKWITKDYPTGIVSVIADTLDFFRVVTEFATELKDDILNRQPNALGLAKVVFRPDSGCPVKILTGYTYAVFNSMAEYELYIEDYGTVSLNDPEAVKIADKYYLIDNYRLSKELSEAEVKGAVECLWEIFGGTTTEQGYKQLHERVGLIYGDSITLERAEQILKRLAKKGFASTNVVFGVGSYTCQYLTRDSMGIAVKATAAVVDGQTYALSKDPATDDGTKKSAKGLLRVEKEGDDFVLYDLQTWEQEAKGELRTVFEDGELLNLESFETIRSRLWNN